MVNMFLVENYDKTVQLPKFLTVDKKSEQFCWDFIKTKLKSSRFSFNLKKLLWVSSREILLYYFVSNFLSLQTSNTLQLLLQLPSPSHSLLIKENCMCERTFKALREYWQKFPSACRFPKITYKKDFTLFFNHKSGTSHTPMTMTRHIKPTWFA